MVEPFHEPYFSPDRFLPLDVFDLFFFIYFQSHLLIQLLVHTNPHDCISALADLLAQDVVAQTVLVREYYLIGLLLLR